MSKRRNLRFRKSSFSNVDPVPFCVEAAETPEDTVAVRHSRDTNSKNVLEFTREEWHAFVRGVKAGEFDF